jgi:hypothetical protein
MELRHLLQPLSYVIRDHSVAGGPAPHLAAVCFDRLSPKPRWVQPITCRQSRKPAASIRRLHHPGGYDHLLGANVLDVRT